MANKYKLGVPVFDKVSGYKGITTSRVEYLSGCVQYGVQAKVDEKGNIPDSLFFDEQRLDPDKAGTAVEIESKPTGGDFQRDRPSARR